MDPQYISKVQQWVEYDNALLKQKESMKDVQDKKREVEEDIISYIEKNKYDNLQITITDGHIKFGKRKVTQQLSLRVLRSILESYNTQEKTHPIDVDHLLQHIQDSLEVKSKYIMTREIK
jgi:hypothetical protein